MLASVAVTPATLYRPVRRMSLFPLAPRRLGGTINRARLPSRLVRQDSQFAIVLLLATSAALPAQPAKAPNKPVEPLPGEALIRKYFVRQAREIADAELRDVKTRDDWEKARPELRRQLLEMLGLWPLPPRTDLHATVTGKVE